MAGFGDLALAFAGGAAQQVNADADAARDSKLRTKERMKVLHEGQRIELIKTEHASNLKKWEIDNHHEKSIKAAGSDPYQRAVAIAVANGKDPEKLATRQRNGVKIGEMTYTRTTPRKRPSIPANAFSENDQEEVMNSASMIAGYFGKDESQLTEVPTSPDEKDAEGEEKVYSSGLIDWTKELPIDTRSFETDGGIVTVDAATNVQVGETLATTNDPKVVPVSDWGWFQHKTTGQVKRGARQGSQLLIDNATATQDEWQSITEDAGTKISATANKNITRLQTGIAAFGDLQNQMFAFERSATEGTTGVTGMMIGAVGSMKRTLSGVTELFGAEGQTIESKQAYLAEQGIDVDDFISSDLEALRGFNKTMKETMVYNLASVLKSDADRNTPSKTDVENAAKMIGNLTPDDAGVGATRAMHFFISTKIAGKYQRFYETRGASPAERGKAGAELLRVAFNLTPSQMNQQVKIDRATGTVGFLTPDMVVKQKNKQPVDPIRLGAIISTYGRNGQLRPQSRAYGVQRELEQNQ